MSILDIMSFCKSRELEVISAFFQQPPCYKPLSFGVILSVHKYVAEFVRNLLCSPVSLEIIELRTHTGYIAQSCASLFSSLAMLKCRRPFRLACNGIHEPLMFGVHVSVVRGKA